MAIRKIITYPNPILRQHAKPVEVFDEELEQLVADMAETMYNAPGAGLAANQIGIPVQVVVIDISPKDQENDLIVLVNPKITEAEGSTVEEEGCLSVIEYSAKVKRAQKVWVEAQDTKGNPNNFEAEDWFARVIQHELDHLAGKLFIDRISSLKRALYKKKLKKILQEEKAEQEKTV